MQQIQILGSQVHYWTYNPGRSRTILMVHGFRGNHVGLERIIAGLGQYTVIVPDLPGYGDSTPLPAGSHDVAGLSEFVVAFMGALQLERPVLLGHSFGSIVAAHVLATHPDIASELILINPIPVTPRAGLNYPVTKLVEAYYWVGTSLPERPGGVVIGSKTFSRLMSLSLAKTKNPATRRLVYRHHLSDLKYPQNRAVIRQSFADSITKTVMADAAHIYHRTLLIAGERDAIAPAAAQKRLQAKFPQAELVIIPAVGHLVHLETPEAAAAAIIKFLG